MSATELEVLLIEDNIDDARLTMRALKKNNLCLNIHHLRDGVEALDYIFRQGDFVASTITDKPKLILLDIKMPKINGLEVLKAIKSDDRTKDIPVVILTSSKEDPDIKTCYRLGANSYIVKPVSFENFISTLSNLGTYWLSINQRPY